jgi:1,4-alpha-glucan branching enzyme
MNRYTYAFIGFFLLISKISCSALNVQWTPTHPSLNDRIEVAIFPCTQGGFLHWGVNARARQWEAPNAGYVPPESGRDGNVVRTRLFAPDSNGICRVQLGPFDLPAQAVRSIDFVIQWDDGSWDNREGQDYHINLSNQRITVEPANPTLNDQIVVSVHRSRPGGQLRWGVNAIDGQWTPPHACYWPTGTVAVDDGLAVDSFLPAPDNNGVSKLVLGPFNSGAQVVTSLHMAVHWDKDWDTDLGRNYNVVMQPKDSSVQIVSPLENGMYLSNLMVVAENKKTGPITLWLDANPCISLTESPLEWEIELQALPYGLHRLTAQSGQSNDVSLAQVAFWHVPSFEKDTVRPHIPFGISTDTNGLTTFALYAPGKRFVSLIGDFNNWNPQDGAMNCSTDGVWWLSRRLEPGKYAYQYLIDGLLRLADPYSSDVEWKDESGQETHKPEMAKSVFEVGASPFAWTDGSFQDPSLDRLIIYEFSVDDVTHGQGFTGTVQWLDHMRDLGVTAVEPMPVQEFTGAISWGYNPSFHFAPETVHGTPKELKELINQAHDKGMAVIMDMVLNHMDAKSPLYQLYGKNYDASPYFYLFEGENWGFPDLDQESPAFKQYVADMLGFWVRDYHVDGFRYDATRWVGWKGYNDWGASWFAFAAKQADSNSFQIAEHLPSEPELLNQTEMDANWDSEFRWRIREMLRNAHLNHHDFARVMTPSSLGYNHGLQRVVYTESHDEERVAKELKDAGFHEQEIMRRCESAMVLTLTAPGIPMIYAGQEFGEDTPKNVGPNFLHWEKLEQPTGQRLLRSARSLIHLRATHPALSGDQISISFPTPQTVIYTRGTGGASSVIVAVNFGREEADLPLALPPNSTGRDILNHEAPIAPSNQSISVHLQPGQSAVINLLPL